MEAAAILMDGDGVLFARRAAGMFEQIRCLVWEECGRLGYREAAMKVYDGRALWQ